MVNPSLLKSAVIGYGEVPASRGRKERGEPQLATADYIAMLTRLTLEHAGMTKDDINNQGIAVCMPLTDYPILYLKMEVSEILGITPRFLTSGTGMGLFFGVMNAIASGFVDRVLILGCSSLVGSSRLGVGSSYSRRDFENIIGGMQGPNSHFAMVLKRHMHQYGTKAEHLGKIAITQRYHATLNPNAVFRSPLSMDEYMASRMIADPLRLYDCAMPVNGGLGILVASAETAKRSPRKPVYLIGVGECYNYYHGDFMRPDITHMGMKMAARDAFTQAGVKPKDMHFFQPYDDYTIAVLMQIEESGFCEKGKGGKFVEETDLTVHGQLPLNTGRGLLSGGQVSGGGGIIPLVEGIRQIMGEGGSRQVRGAKVGCVTNIGGLSYGRNICNNIFGILADEDGVK